MRDLRTPLQGPTLYDVLGTPAPSAAASFGETSITAAKETLDNDSEDGLVTVLLDRA